MNERIYSDKTVETPVRYDQNQAAYSAGAEKRLREKLINGGPAALSDQELLETLLNTAGLPAKELLERLDRSKGIPPVQEIALLTGVGENNACAVVAMLEFGRRRWNASGTKIKHPADIFGLIKHYADRRHEQFLCLSLNGAHEVLAVRIVTVGLVNRTIVHPREVFADPIVDRASAVIVAHNHPSGHLTPSPEDDEITARLNASAKILGLHFLDHLIFSETAFFSYRQSEKL
ncbi:MAG: DNA repair protein RadC [Spirochaetaceae bacterium]|jgi:DNA repair protein RadC|nr:DNA repair protein RadC [Spirochaetaceae bacterium]